MAPPPRNKPVQARLTDTYLEDLIKMDHPLVQLGNLIPWEEFEAQFQELYIEETGRPGISTRLMVGLHYLKHTFDMSDVETLCTWVENPYWQHFTGAVIFHRESPIHPSSLSRWRKRVGDDGMRKLLEGTLCAARKGGFLKCEDLKQLNVDTTVQEKAITYPTDAKLYYHMREKLVKLAKDQGLKLRQTYVRVAKELLREVYQYRKHPKLKKKSLRKLKGTLGCVLRDIQKLVETKKNLQEMFKPLLELAQKVLAQGVGGKGHIYSLHAPEVECISKGKTGKPFEFGVKVGLLSTSKDCWVLAMNVQHGNPYDGHTLAQTMEQAEKNLGQTWTEKTQVAADKGYRKHNYEGPAVIHVIQTLKGKTRSMKKFFKRRSAVEPVIGHMKTDGRLDMNFLKGKIGDQINALGAGAGQNIRKLLNQLVPLPA